METSPKVSIALSTYNGAKYLREAIDSCLNQTYENIELIITDDASTDNTQEIVTAYSDKRIRYIRGETNVGPAGNLNRGFSIATGEFLTWTSYDNIYSMNAIEEMAEELKNNREADFVYANFYRIDETGKVFGKTRVGSVEKLDDLNCIGYCFLYRKKIYEELGGYDPTFSLAEDYEYWLRIRTRFKMKKINGYLYYARLHQGSLRNKYHVEVLEAGRRARDKYITDVAKKNYYIAESYFLKEDKKNCASFLRKSLFQNPLSLRALRLLALIIFPDFLVKTIRKLKHKIIW